MKNFKYAAKKMAALIAAGAMAVTPIVGTMNISTIVAMAAVPATGDRGTLTIKGVESGATVKLYQIVSGENFSGTTWNGWKVDDTFKDATASDGTTKLVQLNSDGSFKKADVQGLVTFITSTSNNVSADFTITSGDATGGYVQSNAPVGTYLVLVTPPATADNIYIYSPMLVSIDYGTNGDTITSHDATASDSVDSNTSTYTGIAYAKKTPVTLTKKITTVDGERGKATDDSDTAVTGEDMQVEDSQQFTINTTIPDYRAYITKGGTDAAPTYGNEVTFNLSDNQDDGLNLDESSIKVYYGSVAGGNVAPTGDYSVTTGKFSTEVDNAVTTGKNSAAEVYGTLTTTGKNSDNNANDFTITFTPAAIY